MEGLYLTLE